MRNTRNSSDAQTTRKRAFTLVEILSAVAVFLILMVIMLQIVSGVQRSWHETHRNLEVFDAARVAFNVIQRDLRGVEVSDMPNEVICFDAAGIGGRDFAFVTRDVNAGSSGASLVEVGYGMVGDSLFRWQTIDSNTDKWNFLNADSSVWAADNSWGGSGVVIDGVEAFSVEFYKSSSAPPHAVAYDAVTDSLVRPSFAVITMTLTAPASIDEAEAIKARSRQKLTYRVDIPH